VVAFSDTADAEGGTASTLSISSTARGRYWGMLGAADYAMVVGAAHGSGLAYMMMLSVYAIDPAYSEAIWNVSPDDDAFWDRWFEQYTDVVSQYAAIARCLGASTSAWG
jgi:hypothetical protein